MVEPYRAAESGGSDEDRRSPVFRLAVFINSGGLATAGYAPPWFIDHEISERYRIPFARTMKELSAIDRQRCITRMRAYSMSNKWNENRNNAQPPKVQ